MLSNINRPVKYIISGSIGAVIHISVLYVLTEYANFWYVKASSIAFLCTFVISFSLQKYWTFSEKSLHRVPSQLMWYIFVLCFGLIVNSTLLYFFVEFANIWYVASQIFTSGAIAVLSFFCYKIIFAEYSVQTLISDGKLE